MKRRRLVGIVGSALAAVVATIAAARVDAGYPCPMPEDDEAGAEHEVPAEMVELHEVLEWEAAADASPVEGSG